MIYHLWSNKRRAHKNVIMSSSAEMDGFKLPHPLTPTEPAVGSWVLVGRVILLAEVVLAANRNDKYGSIANNGLCLFIKLVKRVPTTLQAST